MYTPISCEFFDQLNVAMQRKIPSTFIYLENEEKKTLKGLIKTMSVIDGIEYVQEYDNTYEVQEWITKFKSIRSPVSNWSASTTIRLISTHLAMIFGRSGLRSSNEE